LSFAAARRSSRWWQQQDEEDEALLLQQQQDAQRPRRGSEDVAAAGEKDKSLNNTNKNTVGGSAEGVHVVKQRQDEDWHLLRQRHRRAMRFALPTLADPAFSAQVLAFVAEDDVRASQERDGGQPFVRVALLFFVCLARFAPLHLLLNPFYT
jgi:hypothetical protein